MDGCKLFKQMIKLSKFHIAGHNKNPLLQPTQALRSLIEQILKPIVPFLTAYIKDNWHFVKQLPRTLNYEPTSHLCDTESLYRSIQIDLGLQIISYWLNNKSNSISNLFTQIFILEVLEFILRNNNFKIGEI